ncbi:MAG TPA: signal peptidase I [Patescibacteria group bacterium]|nr:signal peptidase I [Patescibacteria group bacterium]
MNSKQLPDSNPEHNKADVSAPTSTHSKNDKHENFRSIISTIAILLIAPIVAILLTAFVFQSYQVDGQSMENTLHNNDRLIVWKLPKTWSKITHHVYIPNRGDIIVFTESNLNNFGQDPTKQLIKRVIALPGERVVVSNQVVTVYNAKYPKGFRPDTTLPYHRTSNDTYGELDLTVPKGQVFVLGDNRTNSLDSRSFGTVDAHDIVGKLAIRILPVGDMKRF